MSSFVFISHSHLDAQSASAFVDYLLAALELSPEQIRCTSVPGHQLPFGRTIAQQLKEDIDTSVAVVALLTTQSLKSPWVLFELGASWALGRIVVPVLGPRLSLKNLPGPLADYPAIQVEATDAASRFADMTTQIASVLHLKERPGGRKHSKLDTFLEVLRASRDEEKQADVSRVPPSEMPPVTQAYERMTRVLSRLDQSFQGEVTVDGIPVEQRLSDYYREYLAIAKFVSEHPGDIVGAYEYIWEHGGQGRTFIDDTQAFETVVSAFFISYEAASKDA